MCRLRFRINLFHPGIVEVCVHPFFYLVLCFDSLCPLIVAHQLRGRNDHITAHKYSQDPGNDLAWSHRYFLDQARKKGIYFFEPYNCCDSPEKTIQKIDPSFKIKWQFTVIPEYFSEKDFCKYTAQIFISTAKKSTCQKKKTLTAVLIFIQESGDKCQCQTPYDTEWSPHQTASAHPVSHCDPAENSLNNIQFFGRLDQTIGSLCHACRAFTDTGKCFSTDFFGKLYRIGDRRGAAQKMRIRMVIPADPVHSPENICQMCSESTAVGMKLIDHYIS